MNKLAFLRTELQTNLHALYDVSRLDRGGKFINIACVKPTESLQDLPFQEPVLLAAGSGRYRDSDVYLACVSLRSIEDPSSWRFFSGLDAALKPLWNVDQRSAAPLFLHHEVGELSMAWLKPLGLWLIMYNAGTPRGINGRVALKPWGPWSDPIVVFDPALGYGKFMHVKDAEDGLDDPGRKGEWGGEYGPYIIDRYTRGVGGQQRPQAQIYFVLSTWNPYNTMLMTATLQREADA